MRQNMLELTEEQIADIRARDTALHAWMKANKRNSYKTEELPPEINPPTNAERSAVEVHAFKAERPSHYFAYVKCPAIDGEEKPRLWRDRVRFYQRLFGRTGELTTWTGDKLGTLQFGDAYESNLGDIRVPVTCTAINGLRYHGTYYASAGDYARLRTFKTLRLGSAPR
jgi:hypothetical protein